MADGTDIKIEDVIIGDMIKGKTSDNEVIALKPSTLGNQRLYAFNGNNNFFVTDEHPFWTKEGWKSVNPKATKLYNELESGALSIGDYIQTLDGMIRIKSIESKEIENKDLSLYNFEVSGDHSYFADRYCVHNKGGGSSCFIAGTPITMEDGSIKLVESIELKDEVAIGGSVFATGKFVLDNELYDYKGIKVAGSHMVKENNEWVHVRDSKIGKSLGLGDHVVYTFACEHRRILINKTLFTDYFDGIEQEGLKKIGEKYFDECWDYQESINEQIVDFINKK